MVSRNPARFSGEWGGGVVAEIVRGIQQKPGPFVWGGGGVLEISKTRRKTANHSRKKIYFKRSRGARAPQTPPLDPPMGVLWLLMYCKPLVVLIRTYIGARIHHIVTWHYLTSGREGIVSLDEDTRAWLAYNGLEI